MKEYLLKRLDSMERMIREMELMIAENDKHINERYDKMQEHYNKKTGQVVLAILDHLKLKIDWPVEVTLSPKMETTADVLPNQASVVVGPGNYI